MRQYYEARRPPGRAAAVSHGRFTSFRRRQGRRPDAESRARPAATKVKTRSRWRVFRTINSAPTWPADGAGPRATMRAGGDPSWQGLSARVTPVVTSTLTDEAARPHESNFLRRYARRLRWTRGSNVHRIVAPVPTELLADRLRESRCRMPRFRRRGTLPDSCRSDDGHAAAWRSRGTRRPGPAFLARRDWMVRLHRSPADKAAGDYGRCSTI